MNWKLQRRNINEIKPYKSNPRVLTKKGLADLKKSMDKFGLAEPIVINTNGTIIGGHARYEVAKQQGLKEIDVYIPDKELSEEEYKELNVRLNKNIAGEWDFDILANEFDIDDLLNWGFDEKELNITKEVEEDEVPEVQEEAISKLGEIYMLGRHRLMCGDSTKIEDVEKLMDGQRADMVVTSPPYWLGFEYEQEKNELEIRNHITKVAEILSQQTDGRIVINTGNIAAITKAEKIFGKKEIILLIDLWQDQLRKNGYLLRNLRIWAKDGQVRPSSISDSVDMHWEYIGEFLDAGFSANFYKEDAIWRGSRKIGRWANKWSMSGIWIDIKGNARSNNHVAAFPVEIPWRLIQLYSNEGDIVLEPYGGSGTTCIACEQLNRKCYMMELDPKYVDVIIKRWEQFTGKKAVKL